MICKAADIYYSETIFLPYPPVPGLLFRSSQVGSTAVLCPRPTRIVPKNLRGLPAAILRHMQRKLIQTTGLSRQFNIAG